MHRIAMLLVMLLIFPVYSASPPPGEPEVGNDICSTWNSQNGICDDYQSNLDGSTFDEWIKSSIVVNVVNADSVSLTISTAVHELSRSDLDLEDLDLQGDSNFEDGIPADYIRNYLDLERNGFTIEERMISLIQTNMREYIEDNFDYTEDSLLNTISSIDFSSIGNLQCTYDNSQDSIDEVNGIMNDPFNPPLCFRGVFILTLNPDNLGIKENTGDLDRTIRGLLLMGGDVESSFNAKALPGHYVELTVSPPDYSTAFGVENPGILLTKNNPNQLPQNYGHLSLDNTVPENINSDLSENLVMRIKNRDPSLILSIDDHQPSLSIDVFIDARESSNTEIEMILSIHYLTSDALNNWLVDFEDDEMNIPIITSDGIRMLDYELEEDLSPLIQGIPIGEISTGFSELFGTQIDFIQPIFSSSDDSGGLDFRHQNGETCNEMLEVRYCLDDETPMSGNYPIYIQSSSQPVQVQMSNIIQNMLGSSLGDVSTLDFSIVNDEDFAAMMSVVEVNFSSNSGWLQEILPEDFPNTNINLELLLPEWIRSTNQEDRSIVINSLFHEDENYESGFEGTRIFDWQHPICLNSVPCEDSSDDLICSSKQATCITSKAEFFIDNIAINELSGEINIDFDAEIILSIHRLNIDLGEENIELQPIPSDLIRRAIAIGDRKPPSFGNQINSEGGLLGGSEIKAPLDFGNGKMINMTISNSGMSQFAEDLNEIFPSVISDNELSNFALDFGFRKYDLNTNLVRTPFQFNPEIYQIPETITPSDLNPINFSASIKNAEMSLSSLDNQLNLDVHRSSYGSSQYLFQWPFGNPITSDFGITFENSQIQQQIFPIMEYTIFGTIRTSSYIVMHMPDEIRFSSFESSKGLGDISEVEGRQIITYLTPVCPDSQTWYDCKKNADLVTFSLEYSWSFIFVELIPYIILLISLLAMFSVRVRRRRKEKRLLKIQKQELLQSELTEVAAVEVFGSMDSPVVVANESYFEKDDNENDNTS
tara:strand:+ start:3645 stop:6623 length:2979 start_codon:yes stop_codon:yes gene_type:complete